MSARRPWAGFLAAFWPFVLGCVFVAGGFAAIVIGYFGVSGTVYVGLQIPYLVSGVALGLALVVLGSALIVVQALTRQSRLLRRMLAEVQPETYDRGRAAAAGDLVAVAAGGRTFHRGDCLMVEGKSVERLGPAEIADRGLEPCRLCDPVVPAAAEAARAP